MVETQDIFATETEEVKGVGLALEQESIDVPDIFRTLGQDKSDTDVKDLRCHLASSKVLKTLVRICFSSSGLQECETGWLRLIVRQPDIDAPPAQPNTIPGISEILTGPNKQADYVLSYQQRLAVMCPWVLRRQLYRKKTGNDRITRAVRQLMEQLTSNGTSTRIADHRIALIVPTQRMEIHDAIPTTKGVLFYGTLDILQNTHTALLWGCGSNRNLDSDLIHNAMRVIHRLASFPRTRADKLKSELAPSGEHEAFSLLVNVMQDKDVNLLANEEPTLEGPLLFRNDRRYDPENLPQEDDFDFNKLRERYAKAEVREQDKKLVKHFVDLHPFRLGFRVVWLSLGPKSKTLVSLIVQAMQSGKLGQLLS